MKFIVDAQLPRILKTHLNDLGHDAIHVEDLPKAGDPPDSELTAFADSGDRVVVTKDRDFRHMHEIGGHPTRLLHITLGKVNHLGDSNERPRRLPTWSGREADPARAAIPGRPFARARGCCLPYP